MLLKRRKMLWIVLASISLAAALFYASHFLWLLKFGRSPHPVPSEILEVDKGFAFPPGFPPDPGEAGKKMIQGIDSDHDGVRDDVQRWIYAFVPNEPKKQMALRQMTRFFQEYSLSEDFDSDLIRRGKAPLDRAVQCMHKTFDDEMNGYLEGIYLKAKVLNTYGRVKRYWDNNAKITTMDVAGAHPQYESPCDGR